MTVKSIELEKPADVVIVAAPYSPAGPIVSATSDTPASPQFGGSFTFQVNEAGLGFVPGFRVRAASQVAPADAWIEGICTAFDGVNLTIASDLTKGFGTWDEWNINVAGEQGQQGASGAPGPPGPEGPPGPSGAGGVSSIAVQDGLTTSAATGPVTLGVANGGLANGKLAQMPPRTYKANLTGATASPGDATSSQVMTDLGAAPLASPGFSGVPSGPTAPSGTSTTQLATTAFVILSRLDQFATPGADVSFGGHKVTGLADPSSPQDGATKNYVDAVIQGLQIKPTARLGTAAALPANTYANGTGGLGATLTATATGALSIDGVAVAAGDVVLVKNEANASRNGVYLVTNAGGGGAAYVLTRHVDMDTAGEYAGAFVPVGAAGATNANTLWLANPATPTVPGTTAIPFTQLNAATSYTAGNGINIAGNVISAVGTAARITVSSGGIDIAAGYIGQSSITTLGTIASGTWQGTPIAVSYGGTGATTLTGYVKGNGASPMTASATIPSSDVTGLGTMAAQNASAVVITGGAVRLTADPSVALDAATKQYVDARAFTDAASDSKYYARRNGAWADIAVAYLPLTGGTVTGAIVLPADPTTNLQAATKQYVDAHAGGGGISDAPSDSKYYARRNAAWSDIAVVYAPLASPVFTGDPQVPDQADADNDQSAANTKFVQRAIALKAVRYDATQSLTTPQQAVGLANIGAAQNNLINGKLVETHAANATTFAIKGLDGNDPSASNPVACIFADGSTVVITAALSLVIPSTATVGSTSGVPFRLWLALFNDAGTPRLAVRKCCNGNNWAAQGSIINFPNSRIASSTAIAGGSNSNHTFYTGAAVASKYFKVIAYADYDSGMATAGTWVASPSRIVLVDGQTPMPGTILQEQTFATSTQATLSNSTAALASQINVAMTTIGAMNPVEVTGLSDTLVTASGAADASTYRIWRDDATAIGFTQFQYTNGGQSNGGIGYSQTFWDFPTLGLHSWRIYAAMGTTTSTLYLPWGSGSITVKELMA